MVLFTLICCEKSESRIQANSTSEINFTHTDNTEESTATVSLQQFTYRKKDSLQFQHEFFFHNTGEQIGSVSSVTIRLDDITSGMYVIGENAEMEYYRQNILSGTSNLTANVGAVTLVVTTNQYIKASFDTRVERNLLITNQVDHVFQGGFDAFASF